MELRRLDPSIAAHSQMHRHIRNHVHEIEYLDVSFVASLVANFDVILNRDLCSILSPSVMDNG